MDLITRARLGITLGICTAVVSHIASNLAIQAEEVQAIIRSPLRRAGNALLGLLAAIVLLGILTLFVGLVVTAWERLSLFNTSSLPLAATIPTIIIILAGWIRCGQWRRSIAFGIIFSILLVTTLGIVLLPLGINFHAEIYGKSLLLFILTIVFLFFVLLYFFTFVLTLKLTDLWTAAVVGAVGSLGVHLIIQSVSEGFYLPRPHLIAHAILLVLGFTARLWLPILLYPFELAWGLLLLRYDTNWPADNSLLPYHPAFWDELQYLQLSGLDEHLQLAYARGVPEHDVLFETILASKQSWAAQSAQIERTIRQLEAANTVELIAHSSGPLPKVDSADEIEALLFSLRSTSGDTAAALAQTTEYNRRLVLTDVRNNLNGQLEELIRRNSATAGRFRPLIRAWRDVIAARLEQIDDTNEIPNPYVVGVPLTHRQQLFVGRTDISRRIEGILRDQNHPPLLLYGQRRMGKTSLLYQLRWMLPHTILPLVVDLQGPVSLAKDQASFLYNLAKGIQASAVEQGAPLRLLPRADLQDDPFTIFDDWLDEVDAVLHEQEHHTLLLALDEFETLETAIAEGKLEEEAILGTLRHIIQHRPHFKLMLVGSHRLDNFRRWASYLINAQTLHLGYLKESEARQLIERPVENFPLVYAPQASRRVLELTRGHPYLIQLLCAEIVMAKNLNDDESRLWVTEADVEKAIPQTLERGSMFFDDIELNQVQAYELSVLKQISQQPEGCLQDLLLNSDNEMGSIRNALNHLHERELIETHEGRYTFQVELVRRWFARVGGWD